MLWVFLLASAAIILFIGCARNIEQESFPLIFDAGTAERLAALNKANPPKASFI